MTLQLEKSDERGVELELEILNSNPFFNALSKGKEKLTKEDLLTERAESEAIGAERYLIKSGEDYVGILEYLMRNPGDGYPWLGLLVIEGRFHSNGYGYRALQLFYGILEGHGINRFRIGVILGNEPAHAFWKRQGFEPIRTTVNQEGQEIVIYEKALGEPHAG